MILAPLSLAWGQDSILPPQPYPAGIHFMYTYGKLAIKDQYISNEKYSGRISSFGFGWTRAHEKYNYRLHFDYGFSDEMKNNNAYTDITLVSLSQGFIYQLKPAHFLNKELYLYLGPSTDFVYFYNKPQIAVTGFDYAQSFAAMLSIDLRTEAIYPLSQKFQFETSVQFALLSFTFRQVDSEEEESSPAKLLPFFMAFQGDFDFNIRYCIFRNFSFLGGYEFRLLNISEWDRLTVAGDYGVVGLTYRF